jgi:3-dehydroquinate dehydratase type I
LRHDAVEVRFDAFGDRPYDFRAFREATPKPILATNRGHGSVDVARAVEAGIELVDVEWHEGLTIEAHRDHIVVSHHDWENVPELAPLIDAMSSLGCAHVKIAVTPHTLRENELLLHSIRERMSIFGMGERGLYSRILAPFFGSELTFVAPDDAHVAAPGQLTLERALSIYGDGNLPREPRIFAVAGNPAGHSLSPSIHNPLFREHGVSAAYTIASFETFDEIAEAFLAKRITGLSVTAPFKEDAYRFARDADLRPNAVACGAVNTLVWIGERIVADNTDVDGFLALLGKQTDAAIVGAGGTARAAQVACERARIAARVYNRTPGKLGARPLSELASFRGDLIVNTLPIGAHVELPPDIPVIDAAYRGPTGTGYKLLLAQAMRQNALFLEGLT